MAEATPVIITVNNAAGNQPYKLSSIQGEIVAHRISIVLGLSLYIALPAGAASVTINNAVPRIDINGDTLDAHDGCLKLFGQTYYLYGTSYNNQNGFTYSNRFVCYSSPDLVTWTPHGSITNAYDSLTGMYFRPHVVYNKRTGKYVLWYNWYPKGQNWNGQFGNAVSNNPWGPFVVNNAYVTIPTADTVGDFAVYTDGDTTGYCVYGWHNGSSAMLSNDFLSIQPGTNFIGNGEGFCMFKRLSKYYFIWGANCCFCSGGAPADVSYSTVYSGPFTTNKTANIIGATTHSQALGVAEIMTTTGLAYCYLGDRWQSTPNGIKGNDYVYISEPMVFDTNGNIGPLASFTTSWTANLAAGVASAGPAIGKNLARGKTVAASSSYEGSGWGIAYAIDGKNFSQSTSMGWSSNDSLTVSHTEWLRIDLGASYPIGSIRLWPRMLTGATGTCPSAIAPDTNAGRGFPVNFTIRVTTDTGSGHWTTIDSVTGQPNPGTVPQRYSFSTVSARYVKMTGTVLPAVAGQYRMQFAEVGVYQGPTVVPVRHSSRGEEPLALSLIRRPDYSSPCGRQACPETGLLSALFTRARSTIFMGGK